MKRYVLIKDDFDDFICDDSVNSQEGLFVPESVYYRVQSARISEAFNTINEIIKFSEVYKKALERRLPKLIEN